MRERVIGAIVASAIGVIGLPASAGAVIPPGDLVYNGGAEIGPSSEVGDRHPIPGWSTFPGPSGFMTTDYRLPGDPVAARMKISDPGTSGCRAFFGGGEGVMSTTSAAQLIDLSAAAPEIDAAGNVTATMAVRIGRMMGDDEQGAVVFSFLDAADNQLASGSFGQGPTADTRLSYSTGTVVLPIGVRKVRVTISSNYISGPGNTGYIDSIGLTLDGSTPVAPPSGCNGGIATTDPASNVSQTGATLSGTVAPRLDLTSYRFEYGTTTAYGNSVGGAETDGQPASLPVAAELAGLTPNTLYHYRLVAESPRAAVFGGGFYGSPSVGEDMTFQTAAPPPPLDRALSIGYSAKKDRFRGTLKSSQAECVKGAVKVFRARKGRDPKVSSDRPGPKGKWAAEEDARDGRYYARVAERAFNGGVCPAVKSKTIKVG